MGEKLKKAFELAKQAGGLPAQMRLSMKSGMTSAKAQTEADDPEKIRKMEAALTEIIGKNVKL